MPADVQETKKRLKVSLALAIGIGVLEIAGGFYSNSISLVSDAAHVFTDAMSIGLSLFAITLATRMHVGVMTYGYHRAEVLAALANGLVLAGISVWVILEAVHRVINPAPINGPVVILTAAAGLAANLAIVSLLKNDAHKSINVKSAFTHVLYDAVSSVAVLLVGLIVIVSGNTYADAIVAVFIAALIARSAYSIVKESTHILLEGAPKDMHMNDIVNSIKEFQPVVDVHDLHVWTISSGMHALSGHVVVKDQMLSEYSGLVDDISRMLSAKFDIQHTTIQLEHDREISFKRTKFPVTK